MELLCCSGEGGIRTHAPLRTNGFQDRLVMTTSIPLHIFLSAVISTARVSLPLTPNFCHLFFKNWTFIFRTARDWMKFYEAFPNYLHFYD